MNRLVECVPNFSEGRDLARIDAIVAIIREVPGVFVLDRHSDPDHNRTVVTLIGAPEAVAEAALRAVGKAAEIIDLTKHTGAHPRIGATDVLPFVPIRSISMDECALLARNVGRKIWERYRIPVYFYEAAATRPDRVNLASIRKGQFEKLREEIAIVPGRAPDVGEPRLHQTAGAVAVGARNFLIAYNINLRTTILDVARNIAEKIRASNGGLPGVKAMAVDLRTRNLVQVSMNLTDFEQTPPYRVFELVRQEAERQNVAIAGSEIVGLIPRRAIEMAAQHFLQLENFSSDQVLENRIETALGSSSLVGETNSPSARVLQASLNDLAKPLLTVIANPERIAAGVSASALAAAFAASLGELVAQILLKKAQVETDSDLLRQRATEFRNSSRALSEAADLDAAVFANVIAARKMVRSTLEESARRDVAIQTALIGSVEIPLNIANEAANLLDRLGQLEPLCGPSILVDIRIASLLAASAARGALEAARTNLASIADMVFAERVRNEIHLLLARIDEHDDAASR
jgi:glutamate formiminotransferase